MADFRKLIAQAVQKHGLPPEMNEIGYRQLMAESNGNLNAVSPKGAQGPWQFMPATAKGYGLANPNDPVAATDAWGRMMADMLKQTGGNPAHALAAYNWGIGNLNKHGLDKAPKETRDYLSKILGNMPIGVKTADAPKKVYAPAVNAVGAQDVQAAMQFKKESGAVSPVASAGMSMQPTAQQMAPQGMPPEQTAYAPPQEPAYGLQLENVAADLIYQRV